MVDGVSRCCFARPIDECRFRHAVPENRRDTLHGTAEISDVDMTGAVLQTFERWSKRRGNFLYGHSITFLWSTELHTFLVGLLIEFARPHCPRTASNTVSRRRVILALNGDVWIGRWHGCGRGCCL